MSRRRRRCTDAPRAHERSPGSRTAGPGAARGCPWQLVHMPSQRAPRPQVKLCGLRVPFSKVVSVMEACLPNHDPAIFREVMGGGTWPDPAPARQPCQAAPHAAPARGRATHCPTQRAGAPHCTQVWQLQRPGAGTPTGLAEAMTARTVSLALPWAGAGGEGSGGGACAQGRQDCSTLPSSD